MRDENKRIKYSAGLTSEDHENPSDSLSFEVSTKDPSDTSRISKGISYKRHFGSHIPFYWKDHEPQFTVGPHCNKTILLVVLISTRAFLCVHVDYIDSSRDSCDCICCIKPVSLFSDCNTSFNVMGSFHLSLYFIKEPGYSEY